MGGRSEQEVMKFKVSKLKTKDNSSQMSREVKRKMEENNVLENHGIKKADADVLCPGCAHVASSLSSFPEGPTPRTPASQHLFSPHLLYPLHSPTSLTRYYILSLPFTYGFLL